MRTFDISQMVILCYDYGNYLEISQRFVQDFRLVYYFNPNVHDGFQDKKDLVIGEGIKDVIKVKEWASIIDQVDIVFFGDCYEPDLQEYFRGVGKLVFGSGQSSIIETDRLYGKKVLEDLKLPVGKYDVAESIDELEMKLMQKENVYLKSNHRGNHETTKWKSWRLSKGEIRRMRKEMGAFGEKEIYIIEDQLDCIAEIGADTFCVDGRYPDVLIKGLEVKDVCYIAEFGRYIDLPNQVRMVMDTLSSKFMELGYRGWHSNEIIIATDRKGYMLDFTNRMGQPPTSIVVNNITNFSECVVNVAAGIVPMVKYRYRYACQLIIKSDIAEKDDTPLVIPLEHQKYVSVKNLFVDPEGTWWYTHRNGISMREIGAVTGFGNSLHEAISMAKMIAESIQAEDAHVETGSLDKAQEELRKLKRAGINFI